MLEDNFDEYLDLKRSGLSEIDICVASMKNGTDRAFQIRMVRQVCGLDLAQARDVVANAYLKYIEGSSDHGDRIAATGAKTPK